MLAHAKVIREYISMSTETLPLVWMDSALRQDFAKIDIDMESIGQFMFDVGFSDRDINSTMIYFYSGIPQHLSSVDVGGTCSPRGLITIHASRLALERSDEDISNRIVEVLAHELGHRYDFAKGNILPGEEKGAKKIAKRIAAMGSVAIGAAALYTLRSGGYVQSLVSGVSYLFPEITQAIQARREYRSYKSQSPFRKPSIMHLTDDRFLADRARRHYATDPDERAASSFAVPASLMLADTVKVVRTPEQREMHEQLSVERRPFDPWDMIMLINKSLAAD